MTVSYVGYPPFIIRTGGPLYGTDPIILGMLSMKYGFAFSLRPEAAYDKATMKDGSLSGVVYRVRISFGYGMAA